MVPMINRGRVLSDTNIHMTLLFIGDIDYSLIDLIEHSLSHALSNVKSFHVEFNGIDAYIRHHKHLIWSSILLSSPLDDLHLIIRETIVDLNIPYDSKPFFPHVTLMRDVYLNGTFQKIEFKQHYVYEISKLCLYHSHVVHEKLTYTPIRSFLLKK